MSRKLAGKVTLVTGGSSGIGRATALAFAREGGKVIIADIALKGGEETARMIRDAQGEATFIKTDVSKWIEVEALISKTTEIYGRLDCAFNNAGVAQAIRVPTADYTEEDWDRVLNTNLKGVWLCLKYEIKQMVKQKSGAIVNTSSVAGLRGFSYRAAYAASKHGIIGLTKSAAAEYAKDGIRINAVCPGWIRTPMVEANTKQDPRLEARIAEMAPVMRIGTPQEVAEAVVWLCSDAASFVVGDCLLIDGGSLADSGTIKFE
jgi:NAD(P)-dependent dehydrogenase (short-subunit alcohol dehydrogenase family)